MGKAARDAERDARAKGLGDAHQPCYGCSCCVKWQASLVTLVEEVKAHDKRQRKKHPWSRGACEEECMVCDTSWLAPTAPEAQPYETSWAPDA